MCHIFFNLKVETSADGVTVVDSVTLGWNWGGGGNRLVWLIL